MLKAVSQQKLEMYEKVKGLFLSHDNYMIMSLHKVEATQFKNIKDAFPKNTIFLFAKNKLIKKVLRELDEAKYAKVIDSIQCNIIVCFFDNADPKEIFSICNKFQRSAHARYGDVATRDVVVPAGPTGLDPLKINFFQAAHMNTKIVKGKIEIATEHKLVSQGDIVGISEANLLTMLNIMPFTYGLNILKIFEGEEVYDKSVLAIDEAQIEDLIKSSIASIAAISLGADIVTEASLPYNISNAFADVQKVALGLNFAIKEMASI